MLCSRSQAWILEDTLKKNQVPRMGFFDINVGFNYSHARGEAISSSSSFNNNGQGLSVRMQSSFIGNYLADPNKRIRVGDLLAGELAVGRVYQGAASSSDVWLAYNFEFGFAAIATLSNKSDIGLTLNLLKFVRDRISPNVSGSNILLRFRYNKIMAEGGIESRRDRMFGWLTTITTNSQFPLQYTFTGRYLLDKNKNLGARFEIASTTKDYILGQLNYRDWWTLRLFYGLYF
jgi:hypothetical protein